MRIKKLEPYNVRAGDLFLPFFIGPIRYGVRNFREKKNDGQNYSFWEVMRTQYTFAGLMFGNLLLHALPLAATHVYLSVHERGLDQTINILVNGFGN